MQLCVWFKCLYLFLFYLSPLSFSLYSPSPFFLPLTPASLLILFLSPSHYSSSSPSSFSLFRILPQRVLLNGILRGRSQVMSSSLRIRSKGGSHCTGLVKLTLSMMLRLDTVKDSLLWQLYYYCRFVLPSLSLSLSPFLLSYFVSLFLLMHFPPLLHLCMPSHLPPSFLYLPPFLPLSPSPPSPTLSPLTPPLPLYV